MKTRLCIVFVFIALMALVFLLMPAPTKALRQQRTLPDGSILTLEKVTYGKQQHTFDFDTDWWTRFRRNLPRVFRQLAPRGGSSMTTSTGTNGIVFWMSRFNPGTGTYLNITAGTNELRVVDEHGCWQQLGGYSSSSNMRGMIINAFGIDQFPRRQNTFKLVLRDRNAKEATNNLAEFEVPNPGPVSHSVWTPDGLPQSRTNGGLEFVLTGWTHNNYNERSYSYPQYEVRSNGLPRKDWTASATIYHDATGNHNYQSLCTNESAWRLEADFRRTPEAVFAPEEIWSVSNLPVLRSNEMVLTNLAGGVLGVDVKLFALAGPGSYTLTNGVLAPPGTTLNVSFNRSSSGGGGNDKWSYKSSGGYGSPKVDQFDIKQVKHFLMIDEEMHDANLSLLVRGKDDQGRAVEVGQTGYHDRRAIITLKLAPDAQRMDLEFIMNRARKIEFIAAPPVVEAKKRR